MISHFVRASTLAVVCVAALATESPARTPFDGAWSVLIVTTKGDCDRAYRYPISISGQTLINAGSTSFDISGNVQSNGAVKVKVSYGQKSATGSGHLTGTSGGGSWSGSGCGGTWTAERRS